MEELVSAYRAMEAPSVIVSLARGFGGGCLSEQVQQVFMDRCVKDEICRIFPPSSSYIRNCLKQFILAVEAESSCALDSLYDEHAASLLRIEDGNSMAYKTFSYAVPGEDKRSGTVTLRLSLNMLEGGTGCFCWPAGVYLAELVLSYPWLIEGKRCLELGSGAGLVGVCLARLQPFELVLTDGDLSTFANLRHNLEINGIVLDTDEQEKVKCRRLEWEDACSTELYKADIILGADIIYDTACIPHLVKVLALLLQADAGAEAILATVKRNPDTISAFCNAATQAGLEVSDVSRTMVPLKCFQGLVSFDNSDMLLHKTKLIARTPGSCKDRRAQKPGVSHMRHEFAAPNGRTSLLAVDLCVSADYKSSSLRSDSRSYFSSFSGSLERKDGVRCSSRVRTPGAAVGARLVAWLRIVRRQQRTCAAQRLCRLRSHRLDDRQSPGSLLPGAQRHRYNVHVCRGPQWRWRDSSFGTQRHEGAAASVAMRLDARGLLHPQQLIEITHLK